MASIRLFKKEVNNVLSEVIEQCYECQLSGDDKTYGKAEKIIEEAITTFDEIIEKLHQDDIDDYKSHFKGLRNELNNKYEKLSKDISKLKS